MDKLSGQPVWSGSMNYFIHRGRRMGSWEVENRGMAWFIRKPWRKTQFINPRHRRDLLDSLINAV